VRLTAAGPRKPVRRIAAGEDGFTMVFALVALLISGLLVASAFTAASGDISLSRNFTLQTKAYYAAQAGVQRYQHELSSNPNYWVECKSLGTETEPVAVPATADEGYYFKTLPSAGRSACESGKQLTTLETTGPAKGTFRILVTGVAGPTSGSTASRVKRSIVATFAHPGFTKYVYESNYEVEDPSNFEPEPTVCEHYHQYLVTNKLTNTCPPIQFAPTDKVNGPMHTNDAAAVCSTGSSAPTFGRNSEDPIEMNGGHYAASGCGNSPNIVGKYTESAGSLLPPETDAELLETAGLKFSGRTELTLATGSPNTITATVYNATTQKMETLPPKTFPTNGVIYVENSSSGCGIAKYTPFGSDTEHDTGCGNVYVHGEYTESLTIASADDVIVNGNLTTTSEEGGAPTGGATLGLIAQNFVRVYHPVKKGYETPNAEPTISKEAPVNGKCVTTTELGTRIHGTTELSEITTTGLSTGNEVEGTVAGQIESGTLISKIEAAEKRLILNKATNPKAKELTVKLLRSEISEVSTAGLAKGDEVEGTVAGRIEAGTVISEVKESEKKLKLSKATKVPVTEAAGTIKKGVAEITNITTTGLTEGEEVEGSFETGTVITGINASKRTVTLSKKATANETNVKIKFWGETTKVKIYGEATKVKVYVPIAGYAYNAKLNNCHKVESGFDKFIEAENLYIKNCESESTYTSNAYCEYENSSEGCAAKAVNLPGSLEEPVIDAAILSTKHSWIVDNYKCGVPLGKLTVWGSIAQFWRGPVGTSGNPGSGYIKNYNYDERLAAQQPPSFLSPSSTSWKLSRETAPPTGFTH
jgi:Tfp pilus assembly protein PilX